VPAAQLESMEGNAPGKRGPLGLGELKKGFVCRLVFFVKGIPQPAKVVRLDTPSSAELFQGSGIVDADRGVLSA
jgi:hypothetical protein